MTRIVPIRYHGGNGRKKRTYKKRSTGRRRRQKGGFLPILGAALAPLLSGVVSKIL